MTPTSYLELILTFKKLLGSKRNDILTLKNRYLTGLEKLDFAASQVKRLSLEAVKTVHCSFASPSFQKYSNRLRMLLISSFNAHRALCRQVSVMQKELTDLQPELIKTSADTEKLMVKIEQDTMDVEATKEVSKTAWSVRKRCVPRLKCT